MFLKLLYNVGFFYQVIPYFSVFLIYLLFYLDLQALTIL